MDLEDTDILSEWLAEVRTLPDELAKKPGIELICECPIHGADICGDRGRLMQCSEISSATRSSSAVEVIP